jgi:protein-tyrosine phosphatase
VTRAEAVDGGDPTAIAIHSDPRRRRMSGVAAHGNRSFEVPFISRIAVNLWQGGCQTGLVLPPNIDHVISLYPWERYVVEHPIDSELFVRMFDATDMPDPNQIRNIAEWVNSCRRMGETLVHCQAGLNRSGLIVTYALMLEGMSASDAIALLRAQRSPAVLCNATFEAWLRDQDVDLMMKAS